MKKLFKITFALLIIVIGGLVIAPFLIPLETYKTEATKKLSEMTGRQISIDGDLSLRFVPNVAVVLNDVTIGNPKGFTSPYLAKASKLNLGVELSPLFDKELVIQQFELVSPDIYLETNKEGKENWQIELNLPELPKAELISSAHAQTSAEKSFSLSTMQLSELSISGGKLTYMKDGGKQVLTDISLRSDAVRLNQPTDITGSLTWNGEAFNIQSRIDSLEALSAGKPTDAKITLDSNPIKLNFAGKLTQASIRGELDAGSPSLVTLMNWLGSPMAWNQTPLLLAIKGTANCNTSRCELTKANFAVDKIRLDGSLTANYSGKPSITGELSGDALDLTPYMAEKNAAYLNPGWSIISNAYAAAPWSNEPIDLAGLNAADIDLILDLGSITLPEITLKKVRAQTQIRGGSASLNVMQSEVFGGRLSGVATALPRDNYVNASANINASGVDMEQMLMALSGDAGIAGKTDLKTNLTARGNSVAGLIQTLSGKGDLIIRDGAIKGVNLGKMARDVKSIVKPVSGNDTEKTDFAELGGTYNITAGTLSNNDLYMKAPFLRMKGAGTINLPAYTINYRLEPEIVETSQGQGGKDKTGLKVPIIVTGSLDDPQYKPDLEYLLNKENLDANIDAVTDRIKEEKANIKEIRGEKKQQLKDLEETYKDVRDNPAELLKDPSKATEQLNNLLKGF